MRIMTINVWGDYYENPVELREDGIYNTIMEYSPDVFGLQEMTPSWHNCRFFEEIKKEYECVEICDYCHVPLYYKKSKFELTECGWERFRDTPDDDKSVTWAVITERETGKKYGFCNTHFWYKCGPEHDRIREINAFQLASLMSSLHGRWNCPVFAFGDMNTLVTSGVFTVYGGCHIRHLWDLAEQKTDIGSHHGDPVRGEDGLYHGKTTAKPHTGSIDHIIALGETFAVPQYTVVEDQDARDATDHSPVFADVILE